MFVKIIGFRFIVLSLPHNGKTLFFFSTFWWTAFLSSSTPGLELPQGLPVQKIQNTHQCQYSVNLLTYSDFSSLTVTMQAYKIKVTVQYRVEYITAGNAVGLAPCTFTTFCAFCNPFTFYLVDTDDGKVTRFQEMVAQVPCLKWFSHNEHVRLL